MRKQQPEPRPVAHLSLDLRLTTDDFTHLVPSQIAAVFEGIGKLAALQHGTPSDQDVMDDRPKPTEGGADQ